MRYSRDIFLGVKTADWKTARAICEALIGHSLKCTNSTFYGGDHCHVRLEGVEFDLRLNYHDDGDGWSWCVEDVSYPLVLSCYFTSPAVHDALFSRLLQFDLIEVPAPR